MADNDRFCPECNSQDITIYSLDGKKARCECCGLELKVEENKTEPKDLAKAVVDRLFGENK